MGDGICKNANFEEVFEWRGYILWCCYFSVNGNIVRLNQVSDSFIEDPINGQNSLRTDWFESAKLLASDGAAEDNFGYSVSIDGNYAIVGSI